MSSRHTDPALTVRPPAELTARAKQLLGGRSWQMRGFITTCLAALNANPDAFLAQLTEYWPAEKPRGRPRRTPAAAAAPGTPLAADSSATE